MNRLNTDRSLSAFAGQFVPLKLTTSRGDSDWQKWASKYRSEGKGIPMLYVVRADGEQLYGKSGSLPGEALPQMLLAALNQSGRTFSDAETKLLKTAVEEAKAADAEQDVLTTASALSKLKPLGIPGELNSFSALALEADELAKKVVEAGKQSVDTAEAQLKESEVPFTAVLTLVEGKNAYGVFSDLKNRIDKSLREAKRSETLEPLIKQAETLVKARTYAVSERRTIRRRAIAAYEQLITKFPSSSVAEMARQELAVLDPDSEALVAKVPIEQTGENPDGEFRTWTDATGKFRVDAKLVQQNQGQVQLQKRDGTQVSLPIEKLSTADQKFLENR